jgi:aspartate carbamoyltransferase catalytic subunit
VINAGWGHWEHPTQALLDLFTLYRTFGRVEGVRVCIASTDLIEARTGHSMLQGLVRLGADVTVASPRDRRIPADVMQTATQNGGKVCEEFDLGQDSFNELIMDMDVVYLPGCSAAKGPDAETFKESMDDYHVRYETLARVEEAEGRTLYVTHTLPRRAGEMDPRIDDTQSQLYFDACGHGVTIRMALLASILG